MEIERKWLVKDWPEKICENLSSLTLRKEEEMQQGYLHLDPTVRIRRSQIKGANPSYILCLKKGKGLVRQEIEIPLSMDQFEQIATMIEFPLIPKLRRSYELSDGLILEVNQVDLGKEDPFFYAEIEFDSEEQALAFDSSRLGSYLSHEVTEQASYSMAELWRQSRMKNLKS